MPTTAGISSRHARSPRHDDADAEFPSRSGPIADLGITWEWDDMHMPGALSALGGDYAVGHRVRDGVRPQANGARRSRCASGSGMGTRTTGSRPRSRRRSRARCGSAGTEQARAAIKTRRRVLARACSAGRCSAAYAWVAARPVETMPAAELAETWDEVWARIGRCWAIHFYRHSRAIPGPRRPGRPVRVGDRGADAGRGARA